MSKEPNFIRRGVHSFVYALCAVALGITPPQEKYEVPFVLAIFGSFVLIALMMFAVAKTVSAVFG